VQDVVEKEGRKITVPRKIGMAPVQRDGLEYEFDVMFDLDQDSHRAMCTKTRYPQAFPDTFNERLHFDHVEKLAPLLTNDPVNAARIANEEEAQRNEQERQAREREAAARAKAAADRRPPPAAPTVQPPPAAQPPAAAAPAAEAAPQAPAAAAPPPASTPETQPATTPAPGAVDTSGWTPADHVADRIAKATTATELLRVMPDIRKLADADDKAMMTQVYQEKKASLINAAKTGSQP
jgi:hypothetical protein